MNLRPEEISSVGFLLGDKKAGPFKMEIEWIKVERAAVAGDKSGGNKPDSE